VYNFGDIQFRNSEFTLLTIAPFVVIRQKLAYHAKYLRMSWTYVTDLVGVLVRMNFQILVKRSPKGCCYSNQLNMGDVCKRRVVSPLLFASAFVNRLADRKCAFKRFNGNNWATLCLNLVNFRPVSRSLRC